MHWDGGIGRADGRRLQRLGVGTNVAREQEFVKRDQSEATMKPGST